MVKAPTPSREVVTSKQGIQPVKAYTEPTRGPFSLLRRTFLPNWIDQGTLVEVDKMLIRSLLEAAASTVRLDEDWYLNLYPDVVDAIKNGLFENAKHHYVKFGYFEDRFPYPILVDETFYKTANKDIADSIRNGTMKSCQWHFDHYGFKEGRLPYEGWRLTNYG